MANLFVKCIPAVLLLSVWPQSFGAAPSISVDDVERVFPPINASDSRTPLYVALMLAFSGGYISAPLAPGVQIALNLINADRSLLPGYTLHYTFSDSQCNSSVALESFYHEVVWVKPIKIAMFGAGCSVATEPTAAISHFYNITQVSCDSSSPELVNRAKFRKYFQVIPTELELVPAFFGIMKSFGWNQVVMIQQEENLFTLAVDSLQELFRNANQQRQVDGRPEITATVKMFNNLEDNNDLEGKNFFVETTNIYILAMYSDNARKVVCEAYKKGFTYPRYVFITYAWYSSYWWVPRGDVDCTVENMEQVLERSPSVLSDPGILNSSEIVDAGINRTRFEAESIKILNAEFRGEFDYVYYAEHCFDGMWAFALALNKTLQELKDDQMFNDKAKINAGITEDRAFRLEDFTYNASSVTDELYAHLENTDFMGVTGRVLFDKNGIRTVSQLRVQQYRRGTCNPDNGACLIRPEIASVSVEREDFGAFTYLSGENSETTWPNGIPHDGTPNKEIITISTPLTVLMYIFASAGIIFAVFCLAFVSCFRKKKLIRLTSPNLNYIICCGALVLYIAVYVYAVHSTDPDIATVLCNIRPWLAAIGYSLAFGPVLGKMWRVYYIFSNPKPKKKWNIQDWHLALFVACLVLIDLIILVPTIVILSTRLGATLVPHEENLFDVDQLTGIRTEYCFYICQSQSNNDQIWLGVLFGYKAILQIIGILLAFATRKVKVKGLNDAKYIAGVIYITSIIIVVIIISFIALRKHLNALAAIYSVGYVLDTTAILGLIFIPKMIALHKDPDGDDIFARSGPGVTSVGDLLDTKTVALEQKVKELELQLVIYKACTFGKDCTDIVSISPINGMEVTQFCRLCHGSTTVIRRTGNCAPALTDSSPPHRSLNIKPGTDTE